MQNRDAALLFRLLSGFINTAIHNWHKALPDSNQIVSRALPDK